MNKIKIKYRASVYTDLGWHTVIVRAIAVMVSPKMAEVTEVTAIRGETPSKNMTVNGSRRQAFNGLSIARREMGAKKRVSACSILA